MFNTIRQKLLLRAVRRLLAKEAHGNPHTYNKSTPYQAYERIGLEGSRSLERRMADYGILGMVSTDTATLDIGSNTGFFVTEMALLGRIAHGVEPNPLLNAVGQLVARHLGVSSKTQFFDCTFEDFQPAIKYDLIMSLAAFHTADGRERTAADTYFSKIDSMLNADGKIIYESTGYAKMDDVANPFGTSSRNASEAAATEIGRRFKVIRDQESQVLPGAYRRFIVATRRGRSPTPPST